MKAERFTAGVFICVIMTAMMAAFWAFASIRIKTPLIKTVNIDWESIYPFEEGRKGMLTKTSSFYSYLKDRLEKYTSEYLPGYYKIIETAKKYEDAVNWNIVSVFDYNAVVKLKDGYFTTYTMSLDVVPDVEAVKDLADFCAEFGAEFMYINFPTKVCVSEDSNIVGKLDFANSNADRFLAMLKEAGVKCYDFRKNLHDDGMKHHESFFVTDHHWKPETGLWAAGHILEILRDDLGWSVSPELLRPENFEYVVYPEWFLGSQGKKVTLARAKPDDVTMIYPKFETRFHVNMPSVEVDVSGDIKGFYDLRMVASKDYYNLNNYCAYTYGDLPLIRADNKLEVNAKRLLVIKDSFSECVIPFLALGVQHLDVIDLRAFTGSLRTFIKATRPNAVIVEYNAAMPGRTSKPQATETDKKLYDFR